MNEPPARVRLPRRDWLLQSVSALGALSFAASPALGAPRRVSLALNESAFGPSPRVKSALASELHGLERYTGAEAQTLTRQIAELEGVPEAQVLLGEVLEPLGLRLGLRGGPGGQFVYSEPGYTALVDAARPVGGVGVAVPLNARLDNDLGALASKVNSKTRALFLVNPHNPSGTVSDGAAFKAAVSELSKRTLVVVDEAYLEYTGELSQRTLVERVRAGDNVIVFRTFSKIHGLAALPMGYAVAPRALADELRQAGLGSPRALNRLAVVAASASLADPRYLAAVRAKVDVERERFQRVLTELGLRHTDSRASFVFFQSKKLQSELAAAFAAEGIDIGRGFAPLSDWTRISLGLPAENQRAQAALRRALT